MIASRAIGSIAPKRRPMRTYHAIAPFGVGLLIVGMVFLAKDPNFFDQWYEWVVGPILWMMGCTLTIASALGYLAHIGARDVRSQAAEAVAVRRAQHGIITDLHTISGDHRLDEAIRRMEQAHVGTLPVVDAQGRLTGLLTERDVRFASPEALVAERMTPRDRLIAHTGLISLAEAERMMGERKIKKLPLVNPDDTLLGIITAKDMVQNRRPSNIPQTA